MTKGILLLLITELCFALATVFGKLVTNNSNISGVEVTFARFFLGLFIALFYVLKEKKSIVPVKKHLIVLRAVSNTIALMLFFLAVQYTTVTNANMLNLTYPVFVFVISPFINKEKSNPLLFIFLAMTMIGVFLVINPNFKHINIGDLFGLISAVCAAFGITILKEARHHDGPTVILFYLMVIGTVINFFVMLPVFIMPEGINILFLLISGLLGVIGQVLLTVGYKYVTPKSGSIVSAVRIIYASIFGIMIFHDHIDARIIAGGILVIISIIAVTLLSGRKTINVIPD